MKDLRRTVVVLVMVGILAACASAPATPAHPTPEVHREQLFSYRWESTEEIIDSAEAILIGQVASISPSRWNQESGEYWEDPDSGMASLLYYEITLEVSQAVADEIGVENRPVITVLS